MKVGLIILALSGWAAFAVNYLHFGAVGEETTANEARKTFNISQAQETVDSALGPTYKVKEIFADGALNRLKLEYQGYIVDTIYLREDGKSLIRAEPINLSASMAVQPPPNKDQARRAYHDSIKVAMKTANTAPMQLTAAQSAVNPIARIEPPSLPRVSNAPDLKAIYEGLNNAKYVQATRGTKILYMFDDFRCPGCRDAEAYLNEHANDWDVQVRFVPVSVLGPDSQKLAAYVLEANEMQERVSRARDARTDPSSILKQIKNGETLISEAAIKATLENFQFLLKSDRGGTPTFVYLTKDGIRASTVASEERLGQILEGIVPNSSGGLAVSN